MNAAMHSIYFIVGKGGKIMTKYLLKRVLQAIGVVFLYFVNHILCVKHCAW